jgi:hypothetical protein
MNEAWDALVREMEEWQEEHLKCGRGCVDYVPVEDWVARIRSLVAPSSERVDHPTHYQQQGGVECIDALEGCLTPDEFRGFLRGNAIKYLWRCEDKGGVEDLMKADWYLDKLTEAM